MRVKSVSNGPVVRLDTLGSLVRIHAISCEDDSLIIVQLQDRATTRDENGFITPFTFWTDYYSINLKSGLVRDVTIKSDDYVGGDPLQFNEEEWQIIVAILTHRLTGEEMYQTLQALGYDLSGVKNIIRAHQGGYMVKFRDDSIGNLWSIV